MCQCVQHCVLVLLGFVLPHPSCFPRPKPHLINQWSESCGFNGESLIGQSFEIQIEFWIYDSKKVLFKNAIKIIISCVKTWNLYLTPKCLKNAVVFLLIDHVWWVFFCPQFFQLEVYNSDGTPLTESQIHSQLLRIRSQSWKTDKEPMGILTSEHRHTWGEAYNRLLRGSWEGFFSAYITVYANAHTYHHRCKFWSHMPEGSRSGFCGLLTTVSQIVIVTLWKTCM